MGCEIAGCKKAAHYGIDHKKPLRCGTHKTEGMSNVTNRRCEETNCNKSSPNFNYVGEKYGIYCFEHKKDEMENITKLQCREVGCKISPNYGLINNLNDLYCVTHKKDNMIDLKHFKCIFDGCNIRPTFNFPTETKPIYCDNHKLDGMENIISNRCIYEGCNIIASFNYINKTEKLYCATHKLENMINLTIVYCQFEGCMISASYNFPNETKKMFCNTHKEIGMINIVSSICIHEDCKTIACFNIETETKGIYCKTHKTEDMIDIRKNEKCHCGIRACYNYEGETKGLYCETHKLENMINIKKYAKCLCGIRATFGLIKNKPTHCFKCKTDDMFDVVHPMCLTPLCETRTFNPFYRGYCCRCFIYTFPGETIIRNYKTKETAMVSSVIDRFDKYNWIWDKRIAGGSSLRRPDLFLDLEDMVLNLECDENKHTSYDCSDKDKRTMQLSKDVQHRPSVVIRFNPDGYIDKNGKKIPSCWSVAKETGMLKINDMNMWEYRINILCDTIEYWLENRTNKTIEPIALFYNQNYKK